MINVIPRVFRILFLGAFFIVLLAACTDSLEKNQSTQKTHQEAEEPIVIGAILPLTGDGSTFGDPVQKVVRIALDKINSEGGINGRPLKFIWEDGKCNSIDAANAARKLIESDGVKIIYGGFCSSETLGIAPIAEKSAVIELSSASSSPEITNSGDYIFRNYPSDATQGRILAEEANRREYKKIAILSEENDYTKGIEKIFVEQFDGETQIETYLPDDKDLEKALVILQKGNPDAIFINPQTPMKADIAFHQIEEMEWNIDLIANDVAAGYQDLIKKYAELLEGMYVAQYSFDRLSPEFVALEEKYKENTGKELPYGTYASTSYDAVFILKEAIESVGYDADRIKDYLYNIKNRPGLAGNLTIDENGDPIAGHQLEIVKDGKVVKFDTPETATKSEGEESSDSIDSQETPE